MERNEMDTWEIGLRSSEGAGVHGASPARRGLTAQRRASRRRARAVVVVVRGKREKKARSRPDASPAAVSVSCRSRHGAGPYVCVSLCRARSPPGAYGRDIGTTFGALLRELLPAIAAVAPHAMVRLGMTNPPFILDQLDEIAWALSHPNCFAFLHIPVQSGADPVLSAMNRECVVVVVGTNERGPPPPRGGGAASSPSVFCAFCRRVFAFRLLRLRFRLVAVPLLLRRRLSWGRRRLARSPAGRIIAVAGTRSPSSSRSPTG